MKSGLKIITIEVKDYQELKKICDAIANLGYKITFVDDGMIVCEKKVGKWITNQNKN